MTDTGKLKQAIKDSGITITNIAAKMGCSRNRVYSIMNGSDILASEIRKLSEILHVSDEFRDEIFFADMLNEDKQKGAV